MRSVSARLAWPLGLLISTSVGCSKTPLPAPTPVTVQTPAAAVHSPFEPQEPDMPTAQVTQSRLNAEFDGRPLEQFTITNKHGLRVVVLNLGATIASVEVPDRNGKLDNVVCGFSPDNAKFVNNPPYFGVACGRYANRIANGKFKIGDTEYSLATNNGKHHLHGGIKAFDKAVWSAETVSGEGWRGVKLTHVSPDGDEGYPGTLTSSVTYKLTDDNELRMEYAATTDKSTPINLTNHAYWNLKGARPESGTVHEHLLRLNCDRYLPVGEGSIPTGELAPVKETPMDFTTAKTIGADIGKLTNDPQGYDHCWIINGGGDSSQEPVLAAEVKEPTTGRVMRVFTTEPGVQFYTGNYLPGTSDVGGFAKHGALCLETQKFPDSPNQPSFPNSLLKPGETYHQVTVHQFSTE